jgi:hypothetical protein
MSAAPPMARALTAARSVVARWKLATRQAAGIRNGLTGSYGPNGAARPPGSGAASAGKTGVNTDG